MMQMLQLLVLVLACSESSLALSPEGSNSMEASTLLSESMGCVESLPASECDYVCDNANGGWLHKRKGSPSVANATPPKGTGCHKYTCIKGNHPNLDQCTAQLPATCQACEDQPGALIKSLSGDTCRDC